ncbi:MAG: AAA family ATPase, partial [Actinomycetota bacterium]|nr:AAA family ATPase [Actinomycetota bacterium]
MRATAEVALSADGPLATRKVFTKRDVIVAVAPELFGRNLSELPRAVERTLADPEAVPLLAVAGAHQRAYATATTIAREQAIARSVESQAQRRDGAAVSWEEADAAVARAEASLGRPLTTGQRKVVQEILTSGRGVELVVGVAGSGKTTALAAVREAFEAAGYEVVGTSTSGQAARTLGREAGIAESRTLASINWRLSHGSLRLTSRHLAILDEAGMTDDAALLAFLEACWEAGTKVVMVGDHLQLSAVGPGGGFEALVSRFGTVVHLLSENVRQIDPAERVALEQLRSGKVEKAVAWYGAEGRIVVVPDRDAALDAVVAGWESDIANGSNAAMYAWRRANVAELNRRGRQAWEALGRLSGPELLVGSTPYRAGDRIVTLAPGADGQIVTSECGTVLAVDVRRGELAATMDDGRIQRFAGDDLAADHLAHGYAVTVHRSQGATVARAHSLEDGGGRELAYVKLSRAKECSTVYVVADSLEQAMDDLRWSWAQSRRIGWAIDRGAFGREEPAVEAAKAADGTVPARLRHARLVLERDALAAVIPTDPGFAYRSTEARVRRLEHELEALEKGDGWGVLRGTAVGEAAIAWKQGLNEWRGCLARAEHVGLRERQQLRRQAARAAEREGPLRDAFEHLAAPERARIRRELPEAKTLLADLEAQHFAHEHFRF